MQNGSKLGHMKHQENVPEKSTWKMGNKIGKLRSHTSNNMAYCRMLSKRGVPKASSAVHGPVGPIFCPNDKANIITDCLENQFRAHDLRDC
jgi:hypothetical protein